MEKSFRNKKKLEKCFLLFNRFNFVMVGFLGLPDEYFLINLFLLKNWN